jgi:hypothetical protein
MPKKKKRKKKERKKEEDKRKVVGPRVGATPSDRNGQEPCPLLKSGFLLETDLEGAHMGHDNPQLLNFNNLYIYIVTSKLFLG